MKNYSSLHSYVHIPHTKPGFAATKKETHLLKKKRKKETLLFALQPN